MATFVTADEAVAKMENQTNDKTANGQSATTDKAASVELAGAPAAEAVATPSAAAAVPAEEDAAAASAAATKIQAQFRGTRARGQMLAKKHAHLYPYTGPLAASHNKLPPRRALRNPVFAGVSKGDNGWWGCPGPTHTQTIHFDPHGFPPSLEGIYTHEQWTALTHELNKILHSTHLPVCPAGLMCVLLPVFGTCGWIYWQDSLHQRRVREVNAVMDRESIKLEPYGLKWNVISIFEGGKHGRGDISGYVLELTMMHYHTMRLTKPKTTAAASAAAAGTTAVPPEANRDGLVSVHSHVHVHTHHRSTSSKRKSATTAAKAPEKQTMDGEKLIQVQPSSS